MSLGVGGVAQLVGFLPTVYKASGFEPQYHINCTQGEEEEGGSEVKVHPQL